VPIYMIGVYIYEVWLCDYWLWVVEKPFSLMASVVLKEQSKTSKYVILGTSRMDSKDLYNIFYYIPIRLFLNKCVFHSFQRDDMEFNECMPFTSLSDH